MTEAVLDVDEVPPARIGVAWKVLDGPIVPCAPLLVPIARCSVAPVFVEAVKAVTLAEPEVKVITLPTEVAVTPIADNAELFVDTKCVAINVVLVSTLLFIVYEKLCA